MRYDSKVSQIFVFKMQISPQKFLGGGRSGRCNWMEQLYVSAHTKELAATWITEGFVKFEVHFFPCYPG